jgi:hypothetical protein
MLDQHRPDLVLEELLVLSDSKRKRDLSNTMLTHDLDLANIEVGKALLTIVSNTLQGLRRTGGKTCEELDAVDKDVRQAFDDNPALASYLQRYRKSGKSLTIHGARANR